MTAAVVDIDPEAEGARRAALMRGSTAVEDTTDAVQEAPPPAFDMERDAFWAARPELEHTRQFARARRAAPWATLGCVLVHCITAVEPFVVLPPSIGGVASLNMYLALLGESGHGKGAAEGAAKAAFEFGATATWGVGSGEGLVKLYMHQLKGKDGEPPTIEQHTTRVLLRAPEVDTLATLGARQGSTLLPKLRDAWIGDDLSFGYADETKRLPLRAQTYRLGLIVGVQPSRASVLLDHAGDGTPQRFAWLPTDDRNVPDTAPVQPEPWTAWRPPKYPPSTNGQSVLGVCPEALNAIDAAAVARHRGEVEALDGHSLLARLKIAAALGLLNGHAGVNADDWQLAGTFMEISDHTRANAQATLAASGRAANFTRARTEGERSAIAEETADAIKTASIARKVLPKILTSWTPRTDVRGSLSSKDRRYFEDAIDALVAAGTIEVEATTYKNQSGHQYRLAGRNR